MTVRSKQGDQNLPLSNIVYLLSLPCREWQAINEPQSILVHSIVANGEYVECFRLCRMCKTRSLLFLGRICEFQSATSDL